MNVSASHPGRDNAVVSRWIELSQSDAQILFSPVTAAELWAGAGSTEHAALEALFEALVCVTADAAIGRRAGEYLRRYRKSHTVELGDALIAASAVESGAQLWTRNRKALPHARPYVLQMSAYDVALCPTGECPRLANMLGRLQEA